MKLPSLLQFRILKTALTALFSRPYTTRFPYEPYEPIKQFRGRPRYHKDDCIGCGACSQVCPANCIDLVDEKKAVPPVRRLVQHLDACICCGQCERYCTTEKGIKLSNEYDFAGYSAKEFEEAVEKELLLCECCGEVIAPIDQLRWLVKRLGPLTFTNPTLMLVSQKELAVVDQGVESTIKDPYRSKRISMQCPKCRRTTALVV